MASSGLLGRGRGICTRRARCPCPGAPRRRSSATVVVPARTEPTAIRQGPRVRRTGCRGRGADRRRRQRLRISARRASQLRIDLVTQRTHEHTRRRRRRRGGRHRRTAPDDRRGQPASQPRACTASIAFTVRGFACRDTARCSPERTEDDPRRRSLRLRAGGGELCSAHRPQISHAHPSHQSEPPKPPRPDRNHLTNRRRHLVERLTTEEGRGG